MFVWCIYYMILMLKVSCWVIKIMRYKSVWGLLKFIVKGWGCKVMWLCLRLLKFLKNVVENGLFLWIW